MNLQPVNNKLKLLLRRSYRPHLVYLDIDLLRTGFVSLLALVLFLSRFDGRFSRHRTSTETELSNVERACVNPIRSRTTQPESIKAKGSKIGITSKNARAYLCIQKPSTSGCVANKSCLRIKPEQCVNMEEADCHHHQHLTNTPHSSMTELR